jgi:hypothetical protein
VGLERADLFEGALPVLGLASNDHPFDLPEQAAQALTRGRFIVGDQTTQQRVSRQSSGVHSAPPREGSGWDSLGKRSTASVPPPARGDSVRSAFEP